MLEPFDADGVFWLPGQPDERIAGRLTYDSSKGGRLSLIGSFSDTAKAFGNSDDYHRILGISGRKMVTLEDCFQTSLGLDTPGFMRQEFLVGRVIAGAHFEADEQLDFNAVSVTLDYLPQWVQRSGITLTLEHREGKPGLDSAALTLTPLATETLEMSDGSTLSLGFSYRISGDHLTESKFNHGCFLKVERPTKVSLDDDLLVVVGALQALMTLAADVPSLPQTITLWHPDLTVTHPDGTTRFETAELWAHNRAVTPPKKPPQHSSDFLFTFEQLGGLAGVKEWLRVSERFRPALDSLLSQRYGGPTYVENRLQNMVQAAETFHRMRFPNYLQEPATYKSFKRNLVGYVPRPWRAWLHEQLQYSNEPRLKQRLLALADLAGAPFTRLIPDVETWANAVKDARNGLVHYQSSHTVKMTGAQLHWLSESLFYLVVFCLLREVGVASDSPPEPGEVNQRLRFLQERLAYVIS